MNHSSAGTYFRRSEHLDPRCEELEGISTEMPVAARITAEEHAFDANANAGYVPMR